MNRVSFSLDDGGAKQQYHSSLYLNILLDYITSSNFSKMEKKYAKSIHTLNFLPFCHVVMYNCERKGKLNINLKSEDSIGIHSAAIPLEYVQQNWTQDFRSSPLRIQILNRSRLVGSESVCFKSQQRFLVGVWTGFSSFSIHIKCKPAFLHLKKKSFLFVWCCNHQVSPWVMRVHSDVQFSATWGIFQKNYFDLIWHSALSCMFIVFPPWLLSNFKQDLPRITVNDSCIFCHFSLKNIIMESKTSNICAFSNFFHLSC